MPHPEPEAAGVPAWLDAALVSKALGAPPRRVDVRVLGEAGDYFASNMFRVRAELGADPDEQQQQQQQHGASTRSLVVKCEPAVEQMRESLRAAGFFPREMLMLTSILPRMQALLEDAAPGRFPPLAPRCLLHGDTPLGFLVMEDLGQQGFRVADRLRGLGLRHALLAVQSLARFHAASAAILARDPTAAVDLADPWKSSEGNSFTIVMESSFQMLADVCLQWPELPDEYSEMLVKLKPKMYDRFAALNRPVPNGFNVIAHCDFWTNNIMFRYEDSVPVEVRIIDFQISHVVSPTLDLIHFLYTSVSDEVSEWHMDLLIREYHTALCETLEILGLAAPSLEEFLIDMNAHGFFAMYGVVVSLPFVRADKGDTCDLEVAMKGEGGLTGAYNKPACRRFITRVLVDFRKRGWLSEEDFR